MKRIVCTGDSHTWGQGVPGLAADFDPPFVGGELRRTGFGIDSYVNQLRRRVEAITGSRSFEWDAKALARQGGLPYSPPCARVGQVPFTLRFQGALLRVSYALGDAPVQWELAVDGVPKDGGILPAATDNKPYRLCHVHLEEGEHTLTVSAQSGVFPLVRIESYTGPFAVINAGIGSCPSFRYREKYFAEYVAAAKPDIVLAEAHTINDWIAGAPPEEYGRRLEALLRDFTAQGAQTVLMTVAPTGGDQRWQNGPLYEEYVAASRLAAQRAAVPVCDANRRIAAAVAGLTETEMAEKLLDDIWHPNLWGHTLYADLLLETLQEKALL